MEKNFEVIAFPQNSVLFSKRHVRRYGTDGAEGTTNSGAAGGMFTASFQANSTHRAPLGWKLLLMVNM